MIEINEKVRVSAPPSTVWAAVSDPQTVVGCFNGAELGEQFDDGSFAASLLAKFGPLRVKFNARVMFVTDDAQREGHIEAQGRDSQGGTKFRATAVCRVSGGDDAAEATDVTLSGAANLSGKLAPLVESGATVVVARMTNEFAENLSALCTAEPVVAGADPAPHPVAVAEPTRARRRSGGLLGWLRALFSRRG
jgi:carbon monoxide dehydrogenase subunit G